MNHQQSTALQEANRVRLGRARLHREIARLPEGEGRAMLADVLTDPPDFMLTARIVDVLIWPLRMGSTRAQKMMRAAGFADHTFGNRTIGQASLRQRQNLARCLRGLERLVYSEEIDRIARVGEERAA